MLRKTFYLPVLLPVLLLSACRSGNETLEKQNAEILAELKKLNTRMDRMEKRMNAIGTRSSVTHITAPVPSSPRLVFSTDLKKISRIRPLPENPTDRQIIEYVRQIREATGGQNTVSDHDPQIVLYEKIGPGHLMLLLPYLYEQRGPASFHLRAALPKLVNERDKESVRKSLVRYPGLLECVARKGWLKDMKAEVFQLLKTQNNIPLFAIHDHLPELIQSPEDLQFMTDVFIRKLYGFQLLGDLKRIPGVDIKKAVDQAWDFAKKKQIPNYPMITRAQNAVQFGNNVDAFKFLLKMLMTSNSGTFWNQQTVPLLASRCDFPLYDPAALRKWYEKNADRIIYDPDEGKFVLKE